MAPGEVRTISLGTTVTTTVSVGLPANQIPLFVTDFGVPGIVEVDPSTGAVTTVDNTGFSIDSLVFDSKGDIVYTGFGNNELGIYDPSTKQNRIVASLPGPADLALDPGGNSIVVNCQGDQTIKRVDLTTGSVTTLATNIIPGSTVGGIAYDDQGRLFVADNNVAGSSLLQLDPQTGAVLQTILLHSPGDVDGVTFDPVTNAIWTVDAFHHILIEVSDYLASAQVQEFPSPSGFAASSFDGIESDGQGNIFIAEYNSRVDRYNIATNTFTAYTGSLAADDVAPLIGNGSQELTTTLSLPPLTVAAEHIIGIDPATQTVDRAAAATYSVSLTNPLPSDETYTLSTTGLQGLTVGLAASILVPAGKTVTTPLTVTVPASEVGDKLIFTVNAQTAQGAQDSVEGQLTVSPTVALPAENVSLASIQRRKLLD